MIRVHEHPDPSSPTAVRLGVSRIRAAASVGVELAGAAVRIPQHRSRLSRIEAYCMFIGYPRSGHSLVGSLIDAHRDVVLAHECDALKYLQVDFIGRELILTLMLRKAERFTASGRTWTGYSYAVPDLWQGMTRTPLVIGDKKGGGSTARLSTRPELMTRLRDTVKVPIRLIHVVRNPFDNIATMHIKGRGSLASCVDRYFDLCATNDTVRRGPDPVLDVRHEDLIGDSRATLVRICDFLGVDAPPDYLDGCASVVFPTPHQSRHEVNWTRALVDRVHARSTDFDFLRGYDFLD